MDVRQNGGGPYDWMMTFVNSLYGKPYADVYARARLAIHPLYRATPEILQMYRESDSADAQVGAPGDPQTDSDATRGVANAISAGRPYFRSALKPATPMVAAP